VRLIPAGTQDMVAQRVREAHPVHAGWGSHIAVFEYIL
jgi:hypothetical protein